MSTYTQLSNITNPLEIVDKIVESWGSIAVPLYIKDPNSDHKALGYGSGFIVERNQLLFLVTARHVIKDFIDGEVLVANIDGKAVFLNGLKFKTAPNDDIAIAFIDSDWSEKEKLTKVRALPLSILNSQFKSLDTYILLGYPGSKNKLNFSRNETTRKLVGYSSQVKIEHPKSKTHIVNPLAFAFDKKQVTNTYKKKVDLGSFNGNSGGPVLEVIGYKENNISLKISINLAGVFIGWDNQNKEMICCRPKALIDLIDGLTQKNADIKNFCG